MSTVGYTTTDELARLLKVTEATYTTQLEEVLNAALGEVDSEIGLHQDDAVALSEDWQLALAAQVQLERAKEHWESRTKGTFGFVGLDSEGPLRLSRDTWARHANELAPLKSSWGFA